MEMEAPTKELTSHGCEILAIVRSDSGAETVRKAGGAPFRESLTDLESLNKGAASTDGTIQLAFIYDFIDGSSGIDDYAKACDTDHAAISAMRQVLNGINKALSLSDARWNPMRVNLMIEDTEDDLNSPLWGRERDAAMVTVLSRDDDVRGIVVRLAPVVHEAGYGGFLEFSSAPRRRGSWGVLLRLGSENCRAGAIYHGVKEKGVRMKDLATAVGKKLAVSVKSKTPEEACKIMGSAAGVIARDNRDSSEKTQQELRLSSCSSWSTCGR
ncbi:hypothetical protein DOTSEDRAFT_64293 [Dothistroma septosporum NZE10]|uniref:Uncharacterized protein n=1 Tax=Dothistroma septosporum (strain NZE10 / CBS 128990) TaxID=675120 RepID=N1PIP6_DOTSN|nr:hypothetical protein DOTSEDRAFT_64293 [Dothistroma septosporum NZE10]